MPEHDETPPVLQEETGTRDLVTRECPYHGHIEISAKGWSWDEDAPDACPVPTYLEEPCGKPLGPERSWFAAASLPSGDGERAVALRLLDRAQHVERLLRDLAEDTLHGSDAEAFRAGSWQDIEQALDFADGQKVADDELRRAPAPPSGETGGRDEVRWAVTRALADVGVWLADNEAVERAAKTIAETDETPAAVARAVLVDNAAAALGKWRDQNPLAAAPPAGEIGDGRAVELIAAERRRHPVRDLVKAGALIAAEIDRLVRVRDIPSEEA